jgi:hypothetical protein
VALVTTKTVRAGVRPGGWQTFSATSPPQLHWRSITCDRRGCEKMERGWTVSIDESMRLGQLCADYIRRVTQRRGWTEAREASGVTVFTFPPGTPCFQDVRDVRAQRLFSVGPHRMRVVGAPTLYVVGRGRPSEVGAQIARTGQAADPVRVHTRGSDFIEHLAESWNTMADALNR